MSEQKAFACEIADILAKNLKIFDEKQAKTLCELFARSSHAGFNDFLIEEGLADKEDILKAMSIYYGVPAFDTRGYFFDHHLLKMFPKGEMLRRNFIPISHDGPTMILAVADPSDQELPEVIGSFVSYDVTFVVGLAEDIQDAVKEFSDLSLTADAMPSDVEEMDFDREDAERILQGRDEEEEEE